MVPNQDPAQELSKLIEKMDISYEKELIGIHFSAWRCHWLTRGLFINRWGTQPINWICFIFSCLDAHIYLNHTYHFNEELPWFMLLLFLLAVVGNYKKLELQYFYCILNFYGQHTTNTILAIIINRHGIQVVCNTLSNKKNHKLRLGYLKL